PACGAYQRRSPPHGGGGGYNEPIIIYEHNIYLSYIFCFFDIFPEKSFLYNSTKRLGISIYFPLSKKEEEALKAAASASFPSFLLCLYSCVYRQNSSLKIYSKETL
ncbi:hypothetical protein, partial [uncultured Selenomonas sp.]|uniref:hypothetical protein n=1 Tax=uncultured Selenomonas sp. TaxID=159275 RepID=UPI0028D0E5BD